MPSGLLILLGFLILLFSPILIMAIRDYFGWNSNRFYGDEANKNKGSKIDEAYEKNSHHAGTIPKNHSGHNLGPKDNGGDHN